MRTISPSYPSPRSVSAALAAARAPPAITKVGMEHRLRRGGRTQAVMPGNGRRIGEGGDLIDDHAAARGVGPGRVPGRPKQWVKRLRRTVLDAVGEFGQQFPFPGLGRDYAAAVRHAQGGDPLRPGALPPLLPWAHAARAV